MTKTRGVDISNYLPPRFKSDDTYGDDRKESTNQEEPGDQEETNQRESESGSPGSAGSTTENPETESSDNEPSENDQPATAQSETDEKINSLLTEGVLQAAAGLHSGGGSARTTFCLSAEAQALFKDLSGCTGRPQKALLGTALQFCREAWQARPDRLQEAAKSFKAGRRFESAERMPMAIAPDVREGLNELAETAGLHRDQLVEVGIRLARATLEDRVERLVRPHEDILPDLRALMGEVEEVKETLCGHEKREGLELPGQDDPVEAGLSGILETISEMTSAIESEIESGEPVEEDIEFG